jgi:hypothetical protein
MTAADDISLLKEISEAFAKGNMEFVEPYLSDDIKWNIIGENSIIGKSKCLKYQKWYSLRVFLSLL